MNFFTGREACSGFSPVRCCNQGRHNDGSLHDRILYRVDQWPQPRCRGRLFYVDPNAPPGGDGLSEGSAWNDWGQVSFFAQGSGFRPGDSILLQRGCTFDRVDGFWLTANGTSDQPITVGAYGTGAPPVLTNSHFVPDANNHD